MYNNKSWHVHQKHNTARYFFSNDIIFIDHVKSNDNIADLLTKDVIREQVDKSSWGMWIRPIFKELLWWRPNLIDWRFQDLDLKG
jgi:hypothetical protein